MTHPDEHVGKPRLRRVISGPALTLYGLGTMLGAGIYALIGEVVGVAGVLAPLSFIVAAAIASLTAVSFAELSSRFPKSAGEAIYVSKGFKSERLSLLVGLLIVASGVVSSGVMFQGLVGYGSEIITFPRPLGLIAIAVAVGAVAAWGISESLKVIALVTVIEALALIFIIVAGLGAEPVATPPVAVTPIAVYGVLTGAVLSFYAFIGFEDMVNVAEEVKRPRRTLPRAIISALAVATLIYVLVAWTAVRSTPVDMLRESDAPMALIFSRLTGAAPIWMSVIAIIALINGALVQVVMASRVLYGLSKQQWISGWFGKIAASTQTPINATAVVVLLVLLGALTLPLATLARATTFLLLVVFALVNIALIRLKRRGETTDGFRAPIITPYLGAASASAFAVLSLVEIFR